MFNGNRFDESFVIVNMNSFLKDAKDEFQKWNDIDDFDKEYVVYRRIFKIQKNGHVF